MLKEHKAKLAVLVSGGGSNLQALLDAQRTGRLVSGQVSLVISDRKDAYALTRAQQAGVPALTLNKKTLGLAAFEEAVLSALTQHMVEVVVLAGFLTILSPGFIKACARPILNVHPSLIPSFCGEGMYGIKVHEVALRRGVKLTGATVHLVDAVPDGGTILLQKAVRIKKDDTPKSLQRRVMEQAEWQILPRGVEQVCKALIKERKHNVKL